LKAVDVNGNTAMHSFVLNIISDYKDLDRILDLLSPEKGRDTDINYNLYLKKNKGLKGKNLMHLSTPNNKL
jgi:hypothetical protein